MARLTIADRERLHAAVRAAEERTRAEFVLVIVERASSYLFIPMALAAVGALLLPGIFWIAGVSAEFVVLYAAQLATFGILFMVLRLPAVLPYVIPASVGMTQARRLAHEMFHRFGLHATRDRTGILLFVAMAEHYVEIIADSGADKAVTPTTWREIVKTATDTARAAGPVAGFETALARLGEELNRSLPRRPDDTNEIPDRLIVF